MTALQEKVNLLQRFGYQTSTQEDFIKYKPKDSKEDWKFIDVDFSLDEINSLIPNLNPHAEWRDIPSYEGLYQMNQDAEIKRLAYTQTRTHADGKTFTRDIQEKLLKPYTTGKGLKMIGLTKDGTNTKYTVLSLLKKTFPDMAKAEAIPEPDINVFFAITLNDGTMFGNTNNLKNKLIQVRKNHGTIHESLFTVSWNNPINNTAIEILKTTTKAYQIGTINNRVNLSAAQVLNGYKKVCEILELTSLDVNLLKT
jgi:hypothetical protein